MRETFRMWSYTKMIVLTALTAAIYGAVLIPFKILPIIPGFTEVRPGVVVPVVFGILFGPAGAWGSGMGNVIGDILGGTLSLGSIFGAIGNFFFALTAYKLWGEMTSAQTGTGIKQDEEKQAGKFILICILSSSVCALIIAWGLEILKLLPFAAFASVVFLNNIICPVVLGPVLFWLLYPRVKKLDLLWTEIMDKTDDAPHYSPLIGKILMWAGGIGGLVVGILVSTGVYKAGILQFGIGSTGSMVTWSVTPFVIIYLIGCFLV